MARTPLSGAQHTLRAGDYEAVIASVGGTVRSLTFDGRDLIVPFEADEVRPAHRGALLAPWPNRVVDGKYSFHGRDFQVAINEIARTHALHGLASWLDFVLVDGNASTATLTATIEPQGAYPWRVVVEVLFTLDADGLTQTVTATNESADAAPWGTGPHPYLVAGAGTVDDWTLTLPADEVLAVTPDRLIPTGLRPVAADDPTRFDFREPRQIEAVEIDHAYTGLARDDNGIATVRVEASDGHGVQMTWDAACPWVQIHTADKGVGKPGHRTGLAVEPMTCAPDAFNAANYDYDAGLIVLEPGASAAASWTISAF